MNSCGPFAVLRPTRAGDEPFLERVYASTRTEELKLTPWNEALKGAFCRHQFLAQADHYQKHYPTAEYFVIEMPGGPGGGNTDPSPAMVGRLYVDRWKSEIRIMDITVLPEYRGNGIGTHLLESLQREARACGKVLSIHVEKENPALTLYRRLGFSIREDKGLYLLMDWLPA